MRGAARSGRRKTRRIAVSVQAKCGHLTEIAKPIRAALNPERETALEMMAQELVASSGTRAKHIHWVGGDKMLGEQEIGSPADRWASRGQLRDIVLERSNSINLYTDEVSGSEGKIISRYNAGAGH